MGIEQSPDKPENSPLEEQIRQKREESLERAKEAQKKAGRRPIETQKEQQPTKEVAGTEGEIDLSEEAKRIFEGGG